MKKDLTHLLKKEEKVWGFEDLESAREYLAKYLINYINIELQGLPKEEWEKTLKTWVKICAFAKGLLKKNEKERQEIYRKYRFDMMMEGIAEDVRHTIIGLLSLKVIKETDSPKDILLKAVELIKDRDDLIKKWDLSKEVVEFMYKFLKGT